MLLALLFLMGLSWFLYGTPFPVDAGAERWLWFGLSGAIGYALGDTFLFQAFIYIGAQRGMLMMSLAPLMSAGLAWIFFGEVLSGLQIVGVVVTLGGIVLVIIRQSSRAEAKRENKPLRGILYGLGAAAGQAGGFVLAKQGLTDGFSPIAGNTIRILVAFVILWSLVLIRGKAGRTIHAMRIKPRVLTMLIVASFIGPVVGVSLSLFALQFTEVGIASTLIALPPVFLLPISWWVFKEQFNWGTLAGTLVAIAGVALLFLA